MTDNLNKKIKAEFDANAGPLPAKGAYPVTIETPRLILREIDPADAPAILAITQKPGFHYYCFDGTQNTVDAFIQSAIDTRKTAAEIINDTSAETYSRHPHSVHDRPLASHDRIQNQKWNLTGDGQRQEISATT